jgi:hypothetical protein
MRVDKVILQATLSTLAAIAVLFGMMIFALCYIFPATMMNITYDLGMDGASITCAKRSYERTDEVYYIAFATELAILSENDEQIAECGKLLIGEDQKAFETYCNKQNEKIADTVSGTYDQYIYGQVCIAEYRMGDKEQAVNDAFSYLNGGFPVNNGAVALLFTALAQNDTQTVNEIKNKMDGLQTSAFSSAEKAYYQSTRQALETNG